MEFFEKAFAWLAEVSQKLPKVDTNLFFIVVLAVIAGLGVVIAFTLLGSRARKLFLSSRKIRRYLANVDAVDDDNVSDFTAHCFSKKTPQALRDAWVQYLGVRFGYPSDIVSDSAVYDKLVKKNKDVRSGVFLGVSLVLLGLFSFWGYGILSAPEMGTVHLAALVLIGALYLVLVILCRKQNQRCLETFDAMQEDLDAKVNLQIESNYATDSSPLQELNSLVEEIIARNTAKAVDIDDENEQTPIEALIEQKMLEQDELDEIQQDDEDSSAQTEEQVLEPVVEEETQDEQDSDEQIGINDILQEQEASDEEQNTEESAQDISDEIVESEEQENAEETETQSEQEENESLEEVPVEAEDTTEEVSDETPVEEDTQVEDTTEDENLEEENESSQEESSDDESQIEDDNQIEEEPQAEDVTEEPQTEDVVEEPQDEQEYVEAQEDNGESDEQIEEQQEEVEDEQNVEDENQEQNDFEPEDESTEDEESVEENPQSDESDDNLEQEQSEEVVEEEENSEEVASEQEQDEEDNSDEEENSEDEEVEDGEETEESEEEEDPEVVYVVDGDEDEEEHVKPAKLVKLPNLVDYMLSKNMPKAMKIQIATMLISTYNKFKDSKEDRKIVVQCLTKVMRDLQNNK